MKKRICIIGTIVAVIMLITSIILFVFDLLQPGIAAVLEGVIGGSTGIIIKCMDMEEDKERRSIGHDVNGNKNKVGNIDVQTEKDDAEIKGKIGHEVVGDENEIGGIKYVRK